MSAISTKYGICDLQWLQDFCIRNSKFSEEGDKTFTLKVNFHNILVAKLNADEHYWDAELLPSTAVWVRF